MIHASLSPPAPRLIDTSPVAARYELLMAAMMAYILARRTAEVLRLSFKLRHLVRVFIRADRHNRLLQRKRAMLSHPGWRTRVLRELGGVKRLALWEAARAKARERQALKSQTLPEPAWRRTPERLAVSEKLKARARRHAKACCPPNILRDCVKMDFDGLFRLAPLPRGPRESCEIRIFTAADISDYRYNAIPFAPETGLGPATVWPVDFYAAILAETERDEVADGSTPSLSWPDMIGPSMVEISDEEPIESSVGTPAPWITRTSRAMTVRVKPDEREEKDEFISLPAFMGRKHYHALFEKPF